MDVTKAKRINVGCLRAIHGAPNRNRRKKTPRKKGWQRKASHPKAPAGGGGPGGFVTPGVENAKGPSMRRHALHRSAVASGASGAKTKPPPTTTPERKKVLVRKTKSEDIEVYVEILEDSTSSEVQGNGARTTFNAESLTFETPAYSYRPKGGRNVVTAINGAFELRGTITIQTVYGLGAKATDQSSYGRGTTKKDKASGNTSLGFHESRHREDFLKFLRDNPLPKFTGRVGQTEASFQKAPAVLEKAFKRYWEEMEKYSERRTDETGIKRSTFLKSAKR